MAKRWYQRSEPFGGEPKAAPRGLWVALTVLLVLIVGHRPILRGLGKALVVDESPVAADAILVLGGGGGARYDQAVALYRAGLAPVVISSGDEVELPGFDRTYAEFGADYMIALGVPAEAVQVQNDVTSTREEAVTVQKLAEQRGYRTLLVVTDNYHSGRARLTFRQVFRRSDIRLSFVASTPDWVDMDRWWTQERSLLAILQEYLKLGFYLLKGYII